MDEIVTLIGQTGWPIASAVICMYFSYQTMMKVLLVINSNNEILKNLQASIERLLNEGR